MEKLPEHLHSCAAGERSKDAPDSAFRPSRDSRGVSVSTRASDPISHERAYVFSVLCHPTGCFRIFFDRLIDGRDM